MFLPIVVAIFLGVSGLQPSSHPDPSQQEQRDQQNPNSHQAIPNPGAVSKDKLQGGGGNTQNKEQESRWQNGVEWLDRHDGAITAASTFVIAAFTVALFVATRRLWKSGEKHSERELRAYVFPTEIKVINFKTTNRLQAFVRLENSGQTPAYRLSCLLRITAGEFPQTDFTLLEDIPIPPREYMGAGGGNWRMPNEGISLTSQQAEDVTQGRWAIYVFGEIRYKDVFDRNQKTAFRAIARGRNGFMIHGPDKTDVLILSFAESGNEAT